MLDRRVWSLRREKIRREKIVVTGLGALRFILVGQRSVVKVFDNPDRNFSI